MIEEVLKNVRLAEEQAENIKETAIANAEEKKLSAEKQAEAVLSDAKIKAKELVAKIMADAETSAAKNDEATKNQALLSCAKLKNTLEGKVEELSEKVLGGIADGCG